MKKMKGAVLVGGALAALLLAAGAAWSQTDAAEEKPAAEKKKTDSVLGLLAKGGIMMIPIALCSVLAVAVAIERFVSLRRKMVLPEETVDGLRAVLKERPGDVMAAIGYCEAHPSSITNLLRSGLSKLRNGEAAVEKAMEEGGARLVDKMKRRLRPLAGIATIAPLLGLLGTVYGMIVAFQAASGEGVGKGDRLAGGIYEALVTTAAGLTLAVPVLIVHQILSSRIDARVDDLDERANEFLDLALRSAPAREEKA